MIPAILKRNILTAAAASTNAAVLAGILITHHEGRRYVPYRDSVGVLTVCDGRTGPDIVPGRRYSDAECDALLAQDMKYAELAMDLQVRVPITRFHRAALIDFTFNKAAGALASSTLLRLTNSGRADEACAQYHRWGVRRRARAAGLGQPCGGGRMGLRAVK